MFFEIDELTKNNPPELPVIIPTFNNPTYLQMMLKQLDKVSLFDTIILDNGSSSHKMLSLLQSQDCVVTVPNGPRDYYNTEIYKWLPNYFIITDPDIGFNCNLPHDFLDILKNVSCKYKKYKV